MLQQDLTGYKTSPYAENKLYKNNINVNSKNAFYMNCASDTKHLCYMIYFGWVIESHYGRHDNHNYEILCSLVRALDKCRFMFDTSWGWRSNWPHSIKCNIHSLVFCLEGRAWQEPEPTHETGMALAHCILGKFLGVVCHCFPPPLDVPTLADRYLRPQRRERS